MSKKYEDFIKLLKEMFQIEQAKELDFGVYRILNYRRAEIENFLENELLPQVKQALSEYSSGGNQNLKARMGELEEKAKEAGFDTIEELPAANKIRMEYEEIKQKLSQNIDIDAAEVEVYSALLNFFKRYYDKGDFISQRRYKEGVYAIPYEGEEVKLHWANHDQYYIKTTENFRDYTFKIAGDKIVHFKLVEAETEKDNNKEQAGKERRFMLAEDNFIALENDELVLRFEYKVDKDKQDKHVKEAVAKLLDTIVPGSEYKDFVQGIYEKNPTEKNPNRTALEKHLVDYTAKNTFDYFIHKNLGGFVKRELDFYIKSEIMHLEDLDTENEIQVIQYLGKIKAIKRVGHKIIDFLAQLEDFQKKMWLKKKFVVETNYCITLDRVPKNLYPQIVENKAQLEEWVRLFAIDEIQPTDGNLVETAKAGFSDPLTIEFLEQNSYLVLDTTFFSAEFKEQLIDSLDNFEEHMDGLLIHSENFQALNLLQERYKEQIECIYIDPPYNTDASPIMYKNGYKNSTWISLIHDRLLLSRFFMKNDSILCFAIDDFEQRYAHCVLENVFGCENELGTVVIRNNPSGRPTPLGFAISHDYCIFFSKTPGVAISKLNRDGKLDKRYKEIDSRGKFMWELLRKRGSDSERKDSPKAYFPFYVSKDKIRVPEMEWDDEKKIWKIIETNCPDEVVCYPIDEDGIERRWRWGIDKARKESNELLAKKDSEGTYTLYYKYRPPIGVTPTTNWIDAKYSATEHGTGIIKNMFNEYDPFSFPKSVYAVEDCLRVIGSNDCSINLDYFAGSGTTGHAVINLNREDEGNRKYILVEMGSYFNTITKPRIQKVIYSKDWKNGKPVDGNGISHMFKYIKLESYEDALNNIELKRTNAQQSIFDTNPSLKEQYMISYMLDKESEGSPSLLNIDMFKNPFDYRMKIADGLETKETPVDLVETFNYLIGLTVKQINARESFTIQPDSSAGYEGAVKLISQEGGHYCFKTVKGTLRSGEKVLVIWRVLTGDAQNDNAALDAYLRKKRISTQDFEYDLIYVNGDNNLQNMKLDEEHWKVVLTEEEFKKRMFDVRDM